MLGVPFQSVKDGIFAEFVRLGRCAKGSRRMLLRALPDDYHDLPAVEYEQRN